VPNDGKEDSYNINKLLKSLPEGKESLIIFPAGVFTISAPIIVPSNCSIIGAGPGKTIFKQNGTPALWARFREQAIITTNPNIVNRNIDIKRLSILGLYNDIKIAGAKGGICLRNCYYSTIDNVETINTWHGIAFYDNKTSANSNNKIINSKAQNAIYYTTLNNSGRPRGILMNSPNGIIDSCISENCGTGYYCSGDNIQVLNCTARNWTIDNGYYILVNNCTIRNCQAVTGTDTKQGKGSGITIAYNKGGIVEDCVLKNCSNYGLRIHVPESNLVVRNNQAINCGIGIGIENASHPFPEMCDSLIIENNSSSNCRQQGYLFRQTSNSTIRGNTALNNNQGGINKSTKGGICIKNNFYNNYLSGNIVNDTQRKKTQIYGLYIYHDNAAINSANLRNGNNTLKSKKNTIIHKSKYGIDSL